MRKERETMFKRYVKSKRHTMQIDYDQYMWQVDRERKRGAERSRLAGFPLHVPARAAEAVPA